MEHYNSRSQQEDGMAMPVPLSNYNPQQPQNLTRVSAFSKPFSSLPSLLISPKDNFTRNGSSKDLISTSTNSKQPTTPTTDLSTVKYRECLRNHAASNGGHVLDGCGEFMPSSTDSLKCAACDCHRSFHRKHSDSDLGSFCRKRDRFSVPLLLPPHPPHSLHQKQQFVSASAFPISPSVAYGGNNSGSGATTESSSEERLEGEECQPLSGHQMTASPMNIVSRKRFRTRFTVEQKEKMTAFAERLGWRFQRQDDAAIEQFSKESGIRRQVLKVWMHNNKHSLRKHHQQDMMMQQQQQPQMQVLQQAAPAVESAPTAVMFGHAGT